MGPELKKPLGHLDFFSARCEPKLMKLFPKGQTGAYVNMQNFKKNTEME